MIALVSTMGQDCRCVRASRAGSNVGPAINHCRAMAQSRLFFVLNFILCFLTIAGGKSLSAPASPTPPPTRLAPDQLDKSIDEVIHQREYTWRFPRDKAQYSLPNPDVDLSLFERIGQSIEKAFNKIGVFIKDIIGWLKFNPKARQSNTGGGIDWGSAMRILILILILALVVMIVFLIVKLWRQHSSRATLESQALPAQPAPDLEDENVAADQLPENEWIVLARDLMRQGEYRLALRAYYLASLASLADRQLITIARFKSNRDYERELDRRGHALPGLIDLFRRNVAVFERVWYGMHDVSAESVQEFAARLDQWKGGDVPA